jgi:hypothetical protein
MTIGSDASNDEWQVCQRHVGALELQYADQVVRYCRGEAPPPDDGMKATLHAMREKAAALLCRALVEIDQRLNDADADLRRLGAESQGLRNW